MLDTNHSTQIAAHVANDLWNLTGTLAGHAALLYCANQTINYIDHRTQSNAPATRWAALNPFPTLSNAVKKAGLWMAAETVVQPFRPAITHLWNKLTPAATAFLTPIVNNITRPLIGSLLNANLLAIPENISQMGAQILPTCNTTLFSELPFETLAQCAPVAGEYFALGLNTGMQYGARTLQSPSVLLDALTTIVDAVSSSTGTNAPVVGLAGATIGFLALYGLKSGVTNVSQAVYQNTQVNNSNSNSNVVNLMLAPNRQ